MNTLRIILGDQLSHQISSLKDMDRQHDAILMMEVVEEITYVPHHPQKIIFILSAMRHFAEELQKKNYRVIYVKLNSKSKNNSFDQVVSEQIKKHQPKKVVITEAGEYRVQQKVLHWQKKFDIPIEIKKDDRFFCRIDDFSDWMKDKKNVRMETFYHLMRKKTGYLMDDNHKPVGGKWNYDVENRKKLPNNFSLPKKIQFSQDNITQDVIALCKKHFSSHFGDAEPFNWGVTRRQALYALNHFVKNCLSNFGEFQDAMKQDEYFIFHSALSPYLNIGLLSPKEVCDAAEEAYLSKKAPLNATEGFIRQILGWREFVRGVYWYYMPKYASLNFLSADRGLPEFYWSGDTDMNCMSHVIHQTKSIAHSHHIQRLMVTGNYALLAGVAPDAICEWYLAVYLDAFEWVELPNTLGMAIFADGGIMGSKPYAASGNYINKMSDFCASCRYNVKEKSGDSACPFNYLYWNFLIQNEKVLRNNPRLSFAYNIVDKMSKDQITAIKKSATKHLK